MVRDLACSMARVLVFATILLRMSISMLPSINGSVFSFLICIWLPSFLSTNRITFPLAFPFSYELPQLTDSTGIALRRTGKRERSSFPCRQSASSSSSVASGMFLCTSFHVPHSYFTRSIPFTAMIRTNCTSCKSVRSDLHQHFIPSMEHK